MNHNFIFIIIGMALVTYFTRIGAQVIFTHTGIPVWLERWLKHVPTAFLTALIVPALLLPRGYLDITFKNTYLLAGMVAIFTAYKTNHAFMTIAIGMGTMLVLNRLFI